MADKEWFAIVSLPFGAGSYARGKTEDEVIERVKRITKADWKSMYPKAFKKGCVLKVNVFEFEGDEVIWGFDGIRIDGKLFEGPLIITDITY
jgi:ribosomal protein S3AE